MEIMKIYESTDACEHIGYVVMMNLHNISSTLYDIK